MPVSAGYAHSVVERPRDSHVAEKVRVHAGKLLVERGQIKGDSLKARLGVQAALVKVRASYY